MNIAEFVEARAAEREAAANCAPGVFDTTWLDVDYFREGIGAAGYFGSLPPAHTLREVESDRALLAAYLNPDPLQGPEYAAGLRLALMFRASVWRDHPDYEPSWAPVQVSA